MKNLAILLPLVLVACAGGAVQGDFSGEQNVIEDRFFASQDPTNNTGDGTEEEYEAMVPIVPDSEVVSTGGPADPASGTSEPVPPELLLEVRAIDRSEERLGLTTIEMTAQSDSPLRSLYLYSDGFNRLPEDRPRGDKVLSSARTSGSWKVENHIEVSLRNRSLSPCGTIHDDLLGIRRLLVAPNGDRLNDGAPLFNQWANVLASARECNEDRCDGYGESADGNRRPPTCRIDLIDSEGRFLRGEFKLYTRVLAEQPVFTLVAETEDGRKASASSEEIPDPPAAEFHSATVTVDDSSPTVRINADYEGALYPVLPPSGCEVLASSLQQSGRGILSARCPLKVRQEFSLSVHGIGYRPDRRNRDTRIYTIEGQAPEVTLEEVRFKNLAETAVCGLNSDPRWWESCDYPGTLELVAKVRRTWTITGPEGVTAIQIPWVQSVHVAPVIAFGGRPACGLVQDFSGNDVANISGFLYLTPSRGFLRSHRCSRYQAKVVDFDGVTYWSTEMQRDYTPKIIEVSDFDFEENYVGVFNYRTTTGTWEELAQNPCQYDLYQQDDRWCTQFHPHQMRLSATIRNCARVEKRCRRGDSMTASTYYDAVGDDGRYLDGSITFEEEQWRQGNTCTVSCSLFDPDVESVSQEVSYDSCGAGGCF